MKFSKKYHKKFSEFADHINKMMETGRVNNA